MPSIVKPMKPLDSTRSGKALPGGLQLIRLDTHQLKDRFIFRLNQAIMGEDFKAAYLHAGTGAEYASHILAEEKQIDTKGVETWVKVRARNDLFDCECGCLALSEPEWPGGGINLLNRKTDSRSNIPKRRPADNSPLAGRNLNPYKNR